MDTVPGPEFPASALLQQTKSLASESNFLLPSCKALHSEFPQNLTAEPEDRRMLDPSLDSNLSRVWPQSC